ncbi:hypothetical protein RZA67_13630 [Stenotrophomonas sp. C3(2023)]|uniref:hypothetical protein n=1 Tax=Stenotrophomonas sp. C3(2023) TaxID=3080277 RepID=UPI00293CC624|nr:hypothetical protein [Stenotrophomonas sp. C3(2023)]MDV3469760.1 hypothetical protein [Stenotrophomonas sp. C3(2023)]
MKEEADQNVGRDACKRFFDGIYYSFEGMPEDWRALLSARVREGYGYDEGLLLRRGLKWLIEPLETRQPYSFEAFKEVAGELMIGCVDFSSSMHPLLTQKLGREVFFFAAGRMIDVYGCFEGETFEEGNDCFGSLLSLPDALAKSWLWRTGGWRVPSEPFQGPLINRGLIGHPSSHWRDADQYLDSLGRGYKKKFLAGLVSRFPDCLTKSNGIKRYKFRCFLDTRKANQTGPVGDQFFVVSTRTDQVVYHIHHGDVANLRVLHDPADAIDRYCAHVLRNKEGEFDFSPWSELLT